MRFILHGRCASSLRPLWCECLSSLLNVCPTPPQVWPPAVGSEHAARWKCQHWDESQSRISFSSVKRISQLFHALNKVQTSDRWGTINILKQLKFKETHCPHSSYLNKNWHNLKKREIIPGRVHLQSHNLFTLQYINNTLSESPCYYLVC